MARCKWCDNRGLFLSVDSNGLCRNCEHLAIEIHSRASVLEESMRLANKGKAFGTRLSRCELVIEHARYLVEFERKGVPTVSPSPSFILKEFRTLRTQLIVSEAERVVEKAFEKSNLVSTAKGKERVLAAGVIKLREVTQGLKKRSLVRPMEEQLRQEIHRVTLEGLSANPIAPKTSPSESTLSTDLAKKVDDLVRVFGETPVMDGKKRTRLAKKFTRAAITKALDEGITYGQASGGPSFLNQDEDSFRSFIKEVDQNLDWQCDTVAAAFDRFLETGEVPAPHYPMRIAVLLRKAKDIDRERRFLAAWCKHFESGNGTTFNKLLERAKKVGALE